MVAIAPGLQGLVLAVPVVSMAHGRLVLAVVALVQGLVLAALAIPTRDQIRPEQQLEGVVSCSV